MPDEQHRLTTSYSSQRAAFHGTPSAAKPGGAVSDSFAAAFQQELAGVKFSQHALQRLQSRNLQLDEEQLLQLGHAVDLAAQKGSQKSLVVMDDLAMVVSVKSRTVITAMGARTMKDNIVTNIDSAIIF